MYQINVGGVIREFEFFAVPGWEYFIDQVYDNGNGPDGLPLLVMLHGGGQSVENFRGQWRFRNLTSGDVVDENRFFILIPYGTAYRVQEGGEPHRGWNQGYSAALSESDDVAFIQQAIQVVQGWLDDRLAEIGSARRSIDPDRRFLFGYSNGGMMAYRLAADVPNYFRAMWVYAASYGGKALDGFTSLVENVPGSSDDPISVFHLHGGSDATVDPGIDQDYTGLTVSPQAEQTLLDEKVDAQDAPAHARSDRSLSGAMLAYRNHNGTALNPYFETNTAASVNGQNDSTRREWRNAAGDPFPSVVLYRDPTLGHTGLDYVTAAQIWNWFKTQGP